MRQVFQEFFSEYRWIHTGIGLFGNLCFFVGSIFFLSDQLQPVGTWLFIIGSAGMLFGSIGDAFVMVSEEQKE
jgi:hypothetical protein